MKRCLVILLAALIVGAGCTRPLKPAPPAKPPQADASRDDPNQAPDQAVPQPAPEPPPPPPPQVSLEPTHVLQGDFAALRLSRPVAGDVSVRVEGLQQQPRVFRLNGRAIALIGFPAAVRVGAYPVTVTWPDGTWQGEIQVVRKDFTEDRLVVTQEQSDILWDPKQAEQRQREYQRMLDVRAKSHPEPLWLGPFGVPLTGTLRITTYFGEIRFVNGVETGRHSGMDFGAPTGTPVYAPAAGRVVLAEPLIVTGQTVVLDHGMNLFTLYYHCDTLAVKEGDDVVPGQQIATVGNTGFSTGPHLHWTASVGTVPVDPWPLTQMAVLGVYPPPPPEFER